MKGVIAMSDFKKYLAQQMEDSAFAAEYEAQRPEYEAIRAVIAARLACNMTQKAVFDPAVQYQPDRKRLCKSHDRYTGKNCGWARKAVKN